MALDPLASSRVAARWLAEHPADGPVVVVDDPGPVRAWLERAGVPHRPWARLAVAGAPAAPWCPDGPFATAVVRLPKGRDALRMVLHAVAARLTAGGQCLVHGHNDEGIKGARRPCAEVFAEVEAVDARRHCRVWRCAGPRDVGRGELDDWATEVRARVGADEVRWWSWPGLFAHGRLDPGSRLLLDALPDLAPGTAVLDHACGAGALGRALLDRHPGIALDGLDIDALAIHAARRNLPEAGALWLSDGWTAVPPDRRWDVVVSNPPWHAGVRTDWSALRDLVAGAARRLNPGGRLWMVVSGGAPVEGPLRERFEAARIARRTPSYVVVEARLMAPTRAGGRPRRR